MTTRETRAEVWEVLIGLGVETELGYGQPTVQQIVDTLDGRGLLSEDIGPGRTLRTDEEWGLLLCANNPADAEVIPFETRTEVEEEMKDYRERFAQKEWDADAYEPMKIVRRFVPIRPKPPWEEVE